MLSSPDWRLTGIGWSLGWMGKQVVVDGSAWTPGVCLNHARYRHWRCAAHLVVIGRSASRRRVAAAPISPSGSESAGDRVDGQKQLREQCGRFVIPFRVQRVAPGPQQANLFGVEDAQPGIAGVNGFIEAGAPFLDFAAEYALHLFSRALVLIAEHRQNPGAHRFILNQAGVILHDLHIRAGQIRFHIDENVAQKGPRSQSLVQRAVRVGELFCDSFERAADAIPTGEVVSSLVPTENPWNRP